MADQRMVGNAIRRRMGAASSHLGMANGDTDKTQYKNAANLAPDELEALCSATDAVKRGQ